MSDTYAFPCLMVDPTDRWPMPVMITATSYPRAVTIALEECNDQTEGAFWSGCYPIVLDRPQMINPE